jgi:lipopolysaccharide/colanic/teichoic acid biosynthesis glycosyltransferase
MLLSPSTTRTLRQGGDELDADTARLRDASAYLRGPKRHFEFVLLLALLPTWLAAFLAVYLLLFVSRREAVLLRQSRIGEGGESFYFYKFQTLASAIPISLSKSDGPEGDELLFLGRWLRRTSLDELPQLINVLKGEMCIVGPRPFLERDIAHLTPQEKAERQAARPGVTGLWQVTRRYDDSDADFLQVDRTYIRGASALLDLKILFMTLPYVVQQRGR